MVLGATLIAIGLIAVTVGALLWYDHLLPEDEE